MNATKALTCQLVARREQLGLTQQQLGATISRSQSWVAKVESTADDKQLLRNLYRYGQAVGLKLVVEFVKKSSRR